MLTWILSKEVCEQGGVGPREHILQTHAVRGLPSEASPDVLVQVKGVGISLAICHQQQHPQEAYINCTHIKSIAPIRFISNKAITKCGLCQ